ncbi:hypothetical protein T02_13560 [Trichinella nativa]|uniref:Uncharacterized protein n=1 Tax=Trichinella nativa TaxID=6335 RepID=A0A0V1LB76_9BILA|nr:hypothetical protein T02_13560 [Trichinella nativa]
MKTLFFRLLWMCGESVLSRSFQVNGDVASCLPSGVGMIYAFTLYSKERSLAPSPKMLWRAVYHSFLETATEDGD